RAWGMLLPPWGGSVNGVGSGSGATHPRRWAGRARAGQSGAGAGTAHRMAGAVAVREPARIEVARPRIDLAGASTGDAGRAVVHVPRDVAGHGSGLRAPAREERGPRAIGERREPDADVVEEMEAVGEIAAGD